MRAQLHSHDRSAQFRSTPTQFVAALVALGALFGLLVAASAPGVALVFVAGAVAASAVRRGATLVANTRAICVPGTDRCLRRSTA